MINELVDDKMGLSKPESVSSIAVYYRDCLLMGRRRDSGKWTVPGGHANDNETAIMCAQRELFEEAGIKAGSMEHLVSKRTTTDMGNPIMVHAFKLVVHENSTKATRDPDHEVIAWEWIDVSGGLPDYVVSNLHVSPAKNVLFKHLGLT